jgi:hypothetical protein
VVLFSVIGEGSGALYCLADRIQCCGKMTGGANRGIWRFPNHTNLDGDFGIYSSRGFSSLLLNRRSSAEVLNGVYTCVIPDANNTTRTLYIGIYDNDAGG